MRLSTLVGLEFLRRGLLRTDDPGDRGPGGEVGPGGDSLGFLSDGVDDGDPPTEEEFREVRRQVARRRRG